MIKLVILGIILAALIICAFVLAYRALVVVKPQVKERKALHFTGGPLDGDTHYLQEDSYPERYTWQFTKVIASRSSKNHDVQSSRRQFEAIYVHDGDGRYHYTSRVPITEIIQEAEVT